nr:hypothetical protein [Enterovirga sp. DB1703]
MEHTDDEYAVRHDPVEDGVARVLEPEIAGPDLVDPAADLWKPSDCFEGLVKTPIKASA